MPIRVPVACRKLGFCLSLLAYGLTGGCVAVHIVGPGGNVQTVRHFGVLHVEAREGASVSASIQGFGVVADPLGWSIGYTRQRWALLDKDCRMVWWVPAGEMDKEIARELLLAGRACVFDAE
ncbi:MAG: hypothetical protein QM674_10390 [Burkholderiaceae bacterium]